MKKNNTIYDFHDDVIHNISFVGDRQNYISELHLDIDHVVQKYDLTESVLCRGIIKFKNVSELDIEVKKFINHDLYFEVDINYIVKNLVKGSAIETYNWKIYNGNDRLIIDLVATEMNFEILTTEIEYDDYPIPTIIRQDPAKLTPVRDSIIKKY